MVRTGQFLRIDLKFLLEGHTHSYCDRRFGVIQSLFQRQEVVDIPRKWAKVLEQGNSSNWVLLEMIKDFKGAMSHTAHVHDEALHLENVRQLFQVQRVIQYQEFIVIYRSHPLTVRIVKR